MNILVLGSGGREHALAWKIAQSPLCEKVFVEPGNAGMKRSGFLPLDFKPLTAKDVAVQCEKRNVSLVVIGPETLLAEGYGNELRARGLQVFGPNSESAQLEVSKIFAKQFMTRAGLPTAKFQIASNREELLDCHPEFPCVLKYDGLAAGKGVVIAKSREDLVTFADQVYVHHTFGRKPNPVLIEAFTPGVELSFLGLCDGKTFLPLATSTDHKRVGDNDTGPNTGGMGVVSPSPYWSKPLAQKVEKQIVAPLLNQMAREKIDYRGVLYIGLMITPEGEPSVLEFNARFGDPETQALLCRLKSDLVPALLATAKGELALASPLDWTPDHCVFVVAAAEGYPQKPILGDTISGIDALSKHGIPFFAGVAEKDNALVTAGGRVLGISALGKTREEAREVAYREISRVSFRGMHYRKDIGIKR